MRKKKDAPLLDTRWRVLCLLGASVCAYDSGAQPVRATRMTSVSPAHCVAALERGEGADLLRCPTPLRLAVAEAQAACREAGGKLAGAAEGDVWAIDVNADRRNEIVFELDGNLTCTDAWGLFSCERRGCPKSLYELRDGVWTVVGNISAESPEQIALGVAQASDGHRALEVCPRVGCPERWIYEWLGNAYDATRAEVRGTRVRIAGSVDGLHALTTATTVRATPRATGADAGTYAAGTDIEVIGAVEDGDWYYVSPCNSCESGFVPQSAVAVR